MNDKYFEDVISIINQLISEEKFQEAFNIVENERKNFIPNKYVEFFQVTYEKLKRFSNSNRDQELENLTKDEVLVQIFKKYKLNFDVCKFFLNKYSKELGKLEYVYFNNIFEANILDTRSKLLLLEILNSYQIDYEFDFYNLNTDINFKVNPKDFVPVNQSESFKNIYHYCEKTFFKNPSYLKQAEQILEEIMELNYKFVPEIDEEQIADKICCLVVESFEGRKD
ncbi:MAG: DUF3196 family protein [Mycoplasmataceae bacterium]|jgi:hypothetical protein|nr:DUF3196 family protein [Mycoplasmataceae bacterium]